MRTSENYLLGLKALVWQKKSSFGSPSAKFEWKRIGYAEASCLRSMEHKPPEPDCTCGIYATTTTKILERYMYDLNAVAVLVAACGETEVWSCGFRAQAAQVVAVVGGWRAFLQTGSPDFMKFSIGREEQISMIASDYFGLDIVPLAVALEMIDASWLQDGYARIGDGYDRYQTKALRVQKTRQGLLCGGEGES